MGQEIKGKSDQVKVPGGKLHDVGAVRELMATVEYLRQVCEHVEGKDENDRRSLVRGMSVAMSVNRKYADLLLDDGEAWAATAEQAMLHKVTTENDVYKRGALVSGWIEEGRCLNLSGEPVYEDFYTVQVPCVTRGEEVLMEVRFQRVVSGPQRAYAVQILPSVSEVVHCCSRLGNLVRIMVLDNSNPAS